MGCCVSRFKDKRSEYNEDLCENEGLYRKFIDLGELGKKKKKVFERRGRDSIKSTDDESYEIVMVNDESNIHEK